MCHLKNIVCKRKGFANYTEIENMCQLMSCVCRRKNQKLENAPTFLSERKVNCQHQSRVTKSETANAQFFQNLMLFQIRYACVAR